MSVLNTSVITHVKLEDDTTSVSALIQPWKCFSLFVTDRVVWLENRVFVHLVDLLLLNTEHNQSVWMRSETVKKTVDIEPHLVMKLSTWNKGHITATI